MVLGFAPVVGNWRIAGKGQLRSHDTRSPGEGKVSAKNSLASSPGRKGQGMGVQLSGYGAA